MSHAEYMPEGSIIQKLEALLYFYIEIVAKIDSMVK